MKNRTRTDNRWMQGAVTAWTVVVLVITIRLLVARDIAAHSVYPPYIGAARHWIAGADLYGPECLDFRYSPLFAAAFTPFTALSERAGNILWRWLNVAAYLGTLAWWMRIVLRDPRNANVRGVFLLLVIPLSVGSLNNGQSNPLMTALMLGALACVPARRWTTASVLLALAVHLKLYPLALALVMLTLWPRELGLRFVAALAGSALVCCLAQSPHYVAAQFAGWFGHLAGDLRLDQQPEAAYRDLRLMLGAAGWKPAHATYLFIQLAGALGVAATCWKMKRAAMDPSRLAALTYALVACWILLLGPATESCTYILLAPALAGMFIEAWREPRPTLQRVALGGVCLLFLLAMVANWLPFVTKIHALGLHPLAVLLFAGCLVYEAVSAAASSLKPPGS